MVGGARWGDRGVERVEGGDRGGDRGRGQGGGGGRGGDRGWEGVGVVGGSGKGRRAWMWRGCLCVEGVLVCSRGEWGWWGC